MKTPVRALLLAMLSVTVMLAGCADNGPTEDDNIVQGHLDDDAQAGALKTGKGAIEGLLVDDRFRPLELTDEPQTEYQFSGFILVIELGLRVQTNDAGEFTVLDLEPGTYTLRPQVDAHDGFTKKIQVEEGKYAAAQILVRRVSSEGSLILTEEYTGFAPCVVPGLISNCLDASAESYRPGPQGLNYTVYGDNLTYVIVEVAINQPEQDVMIQCRSNAVHAEILMPPGSGYGKAILKNDANESYDGEFNKAPWGNPKSWECILFLNDMVTNTVFENNPEGQLTPAFGIKSQFLISIFIGEPEVDLESYRLLTEDSS